MPAVKHPYRVQLAIIGTYAIIGALVSATVWSLQGPNLGQLVLLMSAPYILAGLALPWLAILGSRQMPAIRTMLAGTGLLASWTYSPEEWRRYARRELAISARQCASYLVLSYTVVFAFTLILSVTTTGQVDRGGVEAGLVVATLFAVPLVIGLLVASLSRYYYNTRHPGDVYIGKTGIYMSGRWYTWGLKHVTLRAMRISDQPPRALHFVIEGFRTPGYPGFWYTVRVPIPAGQEAMATQIYGLFTEPAQPQGIDLRMRAARLKELGYFSFVDPTDLDAVLERVVSTRAIFVPEVKRTYEFFAEGVSMESLCAALDHFGSALRRLRVPDAALCWQFQDNGALVASYPGTELLVAMPFELAAPDGWQVAADRVAAVVGLLLSDCSGENQAYVLFAQDRALVAMLTPDMFRTLWPEALHGGTASPQSAAAPTKPRVARLLMPTRELTNQAVGELGGRLLAQGLQVATTTTEGTEVADAYLVMQITGTSGEGLLDAIRRAADGVLLPEESFILIAGEKTNGLERVEAIRYIH